MKSLLTINETKELRKLALKKTLSKDEYNWFEDLFNTKSTKARELLSPVYKKYINGNVPNDINRIVWNLSDIVDLESNDKTDLSEIGQVVTDFNWLALIGDLIK